MKKWISIIILILCALGYSYLLSALVTWLFSFAFGFDFTWLRALYVWLTLSLITGGIKIKVNH